MAREFTESERRQAGSEYEVPGGPGDRATAGLQCGEPACGSAWVMLPWREFC